MLSPTAIRLSVTTTGWSTQRSEVIQRGRASEVTVSPVTSDAPTATAGDLSAQIDAALEQDPDYQILRKFFALDHATRGWSRSSPEPSGGGRQGRSLQLAIAESQALQRSIQSSVAAVELDLTQVHAEALQRRSVIAVDARGSTMVSRSSALQSNASIQLEVTTGTAQPVQTGDPLVLHLGGTGVTTTGVANGVSFDLDGDGRQEQVSFATGDTWMLALDRDDNGRIDDGRELFGDQNGADHGFAELARYDDNADGVIDATDRVYAKLQLLQVDAQGEQVTRSLAEADVAAIELGYQNVRKAIDLYDSVAQSGHFRRADGSTGEAADVLLGYQDQA